MGRYATRTDQINYELVRQLEEFMRNEHTNYVFFQRRYLPDMSYQTLRSAIRMELSTPEVLEAIDAALDVANWEAIRRDRKTCPHCKAALD